MVRELICSAVQPTAADAAQAARGRPPTVACFLALKTAVFAPASRLTATCAPHASRAAFRGTLMLTIRKTAISRASVVSRTFTTWFPVAASTISAALSAIVFRGS
ncbi:MAG TPA: hypothetical protein VEC75_14250 [Stellaceae bacterium]|nr:hypothetical protein [Stellaceae bacterium]